MSVDSLPGTSAGVAEGVEALWHQLVRFKGSVTSAAAGPADLVTNQLLSLVARGAPMRSGELAVAAQADPSTVSRQVAALVERGLLERRPDPLDGRACLLHVTARGRERLLERAVRRDAHYAEMLADWAPEDQGRFAELMARFVTDFEAYQPTLLAGLTGSRPADPTPEGS